MSCFLNLAILEVGGNKFERTFWKICETHGFICLQNSYFTLEFWNFTTINTKGIWKGWYCLCILNMNIAPVLSLDCKDMYSFNVYISSFWMIKCNQFLFEIPTLLMNFLIVFQMIWWMVYLNVADFEEAETWKYHWNARLLWDPSRVLRCHRICTSN